MERSGTLKLGKGHPVTQMQLRTPSPSEPLSPGEVTQKHRNNLIWGNCLGRSCLFPSKATPNALGASRCTCGLRSPPAPRGKCRGCFVRKQGVHEKDRKSVHTDGTNQGSLCGNTFSECRAKEARTQRWVRPKVPTKLPHQRFWISWVSRAAGNG